MMASSTAGPSKSGESGESGESGGEQQTSPILEECKRLQAIQSFLTELWQDEVRLYESSSSAVGSSGASHHATRNHPNALGGVENETLFPYHSDLYPLLDCYDSIRDGQTPHFGASLTCDDVLNIRRPSPAPLPFHLYGGCRRSKFSPRLDRHGVHIEELDTLEGHLPNSAWAIRQLMPRDRKAQFLEHESQPHDVGESNNDSADNNQPNGNDDDVHQLQGGNVNEIHDEASRHNHTRFWNVLMDPTSPATSLVHASDTVSMPPEGADDEEDGGSGGEWEDADEEDGNEDWGDVDDEGNEPTQASGAGPDVHATHANNARDFTFLKWWQCRIFEERRGVIHDVGAAKTSVAASVDPSPCEYSPESLYKNNPSATFILLKVLKHSLSDLQHEYRLARAVLLLIADWRLCDGDQERDERQAGKPPGGGEGIECLRRLLMIISSEYVVSCGGYCHDWYISNGGVGDDDDEYEDVDTRLDAPNHYCSDWWEFLSSLSTLLSSGITHMTQQHANVICGFVIQEINRSCTPAGPTDGAHDNTTETSSKAYLKQNIYFLNNAEYDAFGRHSESAAQQDGVGRQLNINLLLTILSALRQHAVSDRMRLEKLLDESKSSDTAGGGEQGNNHDVSVHITESLDSFQACVDIMVDIGERCLLRLPTNHHGRQLGGMIVRGLVESYVGTEKFAPPTKKPLSYLAQEKNKDARSLIDPRRYADAVANASSNPLLDPGRSPSQSVTGIEKLIGYQPPRNVQDIVKGLFMRDLVDLQVSGCGYGDFLSWCHLPISPEPLLFDYISNFPNLSSVGENGETRSGHWVTDEDGTELDHAHLSARYDFSLLVFLRQWHLPWTPQSHLSFPIPYRRAVSTLALCAHRYGVPHDISILVNSFLPRSWWSDDRRCCWCRQCQLSQLKQDFHDKITSRQSNWGNQEERDSSAKLECKKGMKTPILMSCPGCQVAMACTKEHLKYLHQDGHKRYCGLPPFRAPFCDEDNALCREIFEEKDEMSLLNCGDDGNESQEDENDDDDSWESFHSDDEEEAAQSKSDVIFSFFNEKSYKLQRREAAPFANFF